MKSVRIQFQFLSRFAQQVRDGVQKLDGTLRRRSELYVESARGVFEQTRRKVQMELGKTEERRVLGTAEHCDDCVRFADMQWQPINTLPPPGQESVCRARCKCHLEYR